jgi:hypothetical protein
MAPSNTYSTKSLTAAHCFTFSILLLLSAFALTFAFTHTVIIVSTSPVITKSALLSANIIVPICSLLLLSLEHLLEMVPPKTLTTLNHYLSVLVLSALLFWGWVISTFFWTQYDIPETPQGNYAPQILEYWESTSTIINKGKIGLGWTTAIIYIIHLCVRAVEAREEIKRQRWLAKLLGSELIEVTEITAEEEKGRISCERN